MRAGRMSRRFIFPSPKQRPSQRFQNARAWHGETKFMKQYWQNRLCLWFHGTSRKSTAPGGQMCFTKNWREQFRGNPRTNSVVTSAPARLGCTSLEIVFRVGVLVHVEWLLLSSDSSSNNSASMLKELEGLNVSSDSSVSVPETDASEELSAGSLSLFEPGSVESSSLSMVKESEELSEGSLPWRLEPKSVSDAAPPASFWRSSIPDRSFSE
mmetsp:Transcript_19447/g.45641  ORF Transcript_19447/g.45641 Transcript_19447/m.45641 type:complete len:212 (+) Transcript_19447:188-823(+)